MMTEKKSKLSIPRITLELLKDPERKSLLRICGEVIYLFFVYRRFPLHYFARYLFKKDVKNIKDYIPADILEKIKPHFNDKDIREVLENKLYFDFSYSQFDVSIPKVLMYNHKKLFVVDKKPIEVNDVREFKALLVNLFKNMPAGYSIFVKKTYWSYGGSDIYRVSSDQIENQPDKISTLYNEVVRSGFIFQESVRQHPEMNRINSSCLNTIRIDTFINTDGTIEVMSAYLRTSATNMYMDNISSGGCMIPIDLATGRLHKLAYFSLRSFGVNGIDTHPKSKLKFENFQIPYFEEVKKLAVKAAWHMPALRMVGWDIGISESGPVVIEGNSNYDMTGNDQAYGGYLKHPVFRKALREINYLPADVL